MKTSSVVGLILIVSWFPMMGPLQIIAYLGPLVIIGLALVSGKAYFAASDTVFVLIASLFALLFSAAHPDTAWLNALVGLLTYSTALLLLVRFREPDVAARTLITTVARLSLVEGVLGVGQLLLAQGSLFFHDTLSAGDAVVGTLGTNSHLYAMKMLFQALLLFHAWHRGKHSDDIGVNWKLVRNSAFVAVFGAICASAILATILFTAAAVMWYGRGTLASLARLRVSKFVLGAFGLAVIGLGFFSATQRGNVVIVADAIRDAWEQGFVDTVKFQKFIVFHESMRQVLGQDAGTVLLGLGLGRYSSRAAMILSGGYLTVHPSWLPVSMSPETHLHIFQRWNPATWPAFGGSIMGMPTNSIQSVIVEFGLLGALIVGWYGWTVLDRTAALAKLASAGTVALLRTVLPPFVLCLSVISSIDLWLEYPQLTVLVYLVAAISLSPAHAQRQVETWTPSKARGEAVAASGKGGA